MSFDASLSKRVLSENETTILNVYLTNRGLAVFQDTVILENSSFDASSDGSKTVFVDPDDVQVVSWILTPKKKGEFQIGVTTNYQTKYFGVVVTDILGLSTRTVYIVSIVGGCPAPVGGIPF